MTEDEIFTLHELKALPGNKINKEISPLIKKLLPKVSDQKKVHK